jgi:hypothetical protein
MHPEYITSRSSSTKRASLTLKPTSTLLISSVTGSVSYDVYDVS